MGRPVNSRAFLPLGTAEVLPLSRPHLGRKRAHEKFTFPDQDAALLNSLRKARRPTKLMQGEPADRLGQSQSFVRKVEGATGGRT
jgi:hypothetical protein